MRSLFASVAAILATTAGFPAASVDAQRVVVPSAESLVAEAAERARAEQKALFVDFRASWCAPCLALQRFLTSETAAPIINTYFIVIPITVWEEGDNVRLNNPGGESLFKKLGGGDGIPYYALLDASRKKLSQRNGFPAGSFGIDDFIDTVVKAAPRMTTAERQSLFDAAASLTNLRVWPSPPPGAEFGPISASGRYLPFVPADGEGLFVHDFVAARDRRISADKPTSPAILSGDGRSVAYAVRTTTGVTEIRIASVGGTPASAKTVVSMPSASRLEPVGWAADGASIVFVSEGADSSRVQLSAASTQDGSTKERHALSGTVERIIVSPDGQQIAVEHSPRPGVRSLVTLATQAGAPVVAVANLGQGRLAGWSRDGSYLLFYRQGLERMTFHAVDMRAGRRFRTVETKAEDGRPASFKPLGMTDSGRLYYRLESLTTGNASVWVLSGLFPADK